METIGVGSEEEEEVEQEDEVAAGMADELRDFRELYGEFMMN